MLILKDFVKKDKEIDFEGRCFIVDFFFCRNIAKMQWKARKNGYFFFVAILRKCSGKPEKMVIFISKLPVAI